MARRWGKWSGFHVSLHYWVPLQFPLDTRFANFHRGVFLFFGGLIMIIGGILEFVLGNTFPFVVFCSFGGFWLTFGVTLIPFYNAYGAYSTTGTAADGLNTQGFNASFGESYEGDTVRSSAG
jgi:hypothetical protein